jgi:transposase-like protein
VTATFSPEFKEAMVRKMAAPGGKSANALSAEVGIAQTTLSRWLREASNLTHVPRKKKKPKAPVTAQPPESAVRPRRPQDWSPEEKMRVLREADGLDDAELGGLLRREGLHEANIEQWRQTVTEAALSALGGRKQRSAEQKKVRQLERELQRKDKALAEAAALLVLQKKVRALWGDEDESTTEESDK